MPLAPTRPAWRELAAVLLAAGNCVYAADGVLFENVTTVAGLDGVHASWSAGWGDYDDDGWLDLAITAHVKDRLGLESRLFRNNGGGGFVDVTRSGLFRGQDFATALCTHGVSFCDLNADGRLDILTSQEITKDYRDPARLRSNELWLAQSDGTFVDIAERAGITGRYLSRGLYAYDFNRDGRLDLLLPCSDQVRPEGNYVLLFRNDGGLRFTETSAEAGLRMEGAELRHKVAVIADFNGDGQADIFTLHPARLRFGRGDGRFLDATAASGITSPPRTLRWHKGGACALDFDNDGHVDLAIAEGNRRADNRLYRNRGDGTFEDVTKAAGAVVNNLCYAVAAGDYDNDGWPDLYFGTIQPGNEPPLHAPNTLLRNNGNGTFSDVTAATRTAASTSGGACDVMFVDYDNDGFLDLFTTNGESNQLGPVVLLRNRGNANRWLSIRLVGRGENVRGLGAIVTVRTATMSQRLHHTGPIHFMSQDDQPLHFGLGTDDEVRSVEVLWPSGTRQTLGATKANQRLTVREPSL